MIVNMKLKLLRLTFFVVQFQIQLIGSRVQFSGSADQIALFPVRSNPRWQPAAVLKKFECSYISDHPVYFAYGSMVGFSGSADRVALFAVGPNRIGT